jgi:hypothetical protein
MEKTINHNKEPDIKKETNDNWQFKTKMIYIYKTGNIQVWQEDVLLYEGPSIEMAKASTIPF